MGEMGPEAGMSSAIHYSRDYSKREKGTDAASEEGECECISTQG